MKNLCFLFIVMFGLSTNSSAQYTINALEQGQEIRVNQSLRSANGMYTLILQTDGNLCVYKNAANYDYSSVWCSMTNGKAAKVLKMQTDGHLCLYDKNNAPLFCSDTYQGGADKIGKKLELKNDGSLVLNNSAGNPIWKNGKRLY